MDSVVVFPALLGGSFVAVAVALRLNFFGPNSRVWRNCLFCAVLGGALGAIISLGGLGFPAQPGDGVVDVFIALLCATSGAVAGLVLSALWWYVGRHLTH